MTTEPQQSYPQQQQPYFEDEIDLREYIAVLFKYWMWIVGAAILTAVVAFVASSMMPKTYQSAADVIVLRSRTDISLEPKFLTEMEATNQRDERDALVSLVHSTDLAAQVLEQVRNILPEEQQDVQRLLKKVKASSEGNTITITVTDKDPVVAAQIANEWAQAYERYVNQVFAGRNVLLLTEIEGQSDDMAQTYQLAQGNWEQFLGENQTAELQRELDVLNEQVQALRQQDAIAEKLPLTLNTLELDTKQALLNNKYNELKQLERWEQDALALKDQLAADTGSTAANAGNVLALILLRNEVLASSRNNSVQLQLNLTDISESDISAADVDALLEVIDARRIRVEDEIVALSNELLQTDLPISLKARSEETSQLINTLDERILALEVELEQQVAQRRELAEVKDLAWENYTTVKRKVAEVALASQITDSQVRVVSGAIVPNNAVSPKRMRNTLIGGVLGGMAAVFAVFFIEYWRSGKKEEEVKSK